MNKSELKAIFINAKATDAKYIGVSIQTEGSSQPEIIINPNPNFDAKFDYYMEAYDDDLILIAAKGKKDIRITAAGQGNRFEDIECQLLGERGNKWIAKKTKATRNAMILKVLNEMTKGKEVTVENLDSLKDIFNEQLDPAIADNAVVITNQSGFNYLDKLKDKDGNYILQKDPTQQTKGKMLFGEYPIIKLSKKTLASEKIMNTDGHTIEGYKHPIFCGDLKEAVTLFDRNVLTIDLNDKGAGLWDKDMTGIKVRDRFDVQPVDKGAVIKGQITEVING